MQLISSFQDKVTEFVSSCRNTLLFCDTERQFSVQFLLTVTIQLYFEKAKGYAGKLTAFPASVCWLFLLFCYCTQLRVRA